MSASQLESAQALELMRRVPNDPTAFDRLYHQFANRLINTLRSKGISITDCEECCQETWMTVHQRSMGLDLPQEGNFFGWLVTIAHRKFVDRTRKQKPLPLATDFDVPERDREKEEIWQPDEQEGLRYVECRERLTEAERSVFDSRFQGDSSEETAHKLNVTVQIVHGTLHRAKTKMKQCLESISPTIS